MSVSKSTRNMHPCAWSKPKCSDFGFDVEDPAVFARSQCSTRLPSRFVYLIYRLALACYLTGAQTFIIYQLFPSYRFKLFIFITEWTVSVFTLYSLLSLFGALCNKPALTDLHGYDILKQSDGPPKPPRHVKTSTPFIFKLAWILFDVCLSVCPFVTLIYWYMMYDKDNGYYGSSDTMTEKIKFFAIDIHEHAFITFLVYLDLFISAAPVRIVHMIYGIIFGILYITFTVIYWYLGGTTPWDDTAVYSIIDWDAPIDTAYYLAGAVGVIGVFHLFGYALYKIRVCFYSCCCAPNPGARKPPKQSQKQPQKPSKKQITKPYHAYFVLTTTTPGDENGGTFEHAPLARVDSSEL
ncbi:protein rolling stone-like [Amphiura filiformis]|uniref:protein rolling stone-like n=1 Tax=Amphiura filiformis TaxID=82378 RepID=UPI003B21670B